MKPSGSNPMNPCEQAKSGWHIFVPKGKKGAKENKRCTLCGKHFADCEKE